MSARVDVIAVMIDAGNTIAIRCGDDAAIEIRKAHRLVAELVEAATKVAMRRHTHRASGVVRSDLCAICGDDIRSGVHFRVGETERGDFDNLRAALSAVGGAQ